MASWFDGLSSSLGCYLGPMSHGVVSFTRHISRCTKDVWMMESKTEESNELRRKEVETTKETLRPKLERLMTFYNDLDLENKQETAAYNDLIIKRDLDIKLFIGKETLVTEKLLNLQEDIESVNVAAGFIPVVSSTSWSENIDPKSFEYKHELEQKNLEVEILRERHEAMKHKLLKLQKATEPINGAPGLIPAMPASISLSDNMDPNTSQYEHLLEQKNLEVKILRGRNIAMKHKLLKLQKATQCLNAAAGLIPTMPALNSLGDNIDHNVSEYKNQLEQQNLEMRIIRGRNVAMKDKLLKLQKATQCLNAAAGLLPAMSSASLGESTDPSASQYEHALEQKNLEVKILRGRNVAMKHKLLKLQKATQCLNVAAGLIPATSSASLGENIDPNTSQYEHELEQKNLEVKILRGRNVAMKHKLLKLRKATQYLNAAAGLEPAMPLLILLSDNIDHNAPEYKNQLEQQNFEMKTLRRRNVAMKQKLLKLQKATECLNAAAGLLPAMSSVSQGENIDPNASKYEHELQQKNLEMKILRGRNVRMKQKLLKLQKATECLNAAAGLLPAMSSASLGENIDPNASEYERELQQKNMEVKILRGRNIAMKYKLFKVRKATECLNVAAGLRPAMSSTSLGENIEPNTSQYEHELEQKNLEVKILRGRNVALKHKLLKLQKATQCLNAAAGLIPTMPASNSLGDNIDHNASEYKNQLEQQNLEMRIIRGRNVAMKDKLLKLQKATQCLNAAAGLLPAMSSASLGESTDPSASQYEHALEQKNLEVKILRGRNVAMKHKLLKLQKATQCLNVAAGLIPATSSASLGENIDPNTSQYEHELEQKNLEVKILRGRNVAMKHKLLKLRKATQYLNAAAGLEPAMPLLILLSDNIDHNAPEYKNQLEQQNFEMKTLRRRNVAMKQKLLKLQKATECLNAAAGLLPAMSSVSQGENIDPNASKYEHELQQKNLEMKILRGRNVRMKQKLLKLQKATECLNAAAGLLPAMSSASLGENIDPNASEYERELQQKNMEVKILRGRNIAMKYKLFKVRKATECLNVAAGLRPAMSSTSLGENIEPNTSQYEHELEQKNLEVKILRGRNVALKHKLLKLQKATQCLNAAAGLIPTMPASNSLGDNIDHNASEYKNQLEQQNLEMRIIRGRNVAMKDKLLKLQKATQCLNAAAGLLPAMSSASLGESTDPSASQYEHALEQKNLEVKILRGRNVAMKHKLLKLQKATQCLNVAAGLIPATSSASLGENIDPNTSQYEHELEQKNLEVKILRGRNVAMKHKLLKLRKATQYLNAAAGLEPAMPLLILLSDNIDHNAPEYKNQLEQQNFEMKTLRRRNVAMKQKLLKLQKATECLNAAAGLLPAMSSVSQGENIDPNASKYEHELQQKNLEMKILRGRNVRMKQKLLKLQKATECLNAAAGLLPAMSSASLGENIDPNASEYERELQQKNMEVKILRGRNIAMKYKLFKVRKATECLNVAAGLRPAMSSTSLGENIEPNTSQYEHELEQKNLEVKILRGRNVALKHKLLKLQKATQCLNAAAGLIPTMPASNSLGDNIDHNASEYKNQLEQQNLEMRIIRGRNVAMKDKLLKLQKATQCLNAAAGLLPAMSSASLGESTDPSASEYEHELEQENLEVKILRGRNVAMKNKLLKLQKATQCLNAAFDLLPVTSSASLGKNIDPNAFQYEHALEQKNLEVKILRGRNVTMRHKLLKLQKATQCLNAATSLEPAMPLSTSLGDNIDHDAPEYKNQLKQQNLDMKILRGRNVAMKHKLLKLQKAIHCLSAAAGLLPATALASLGESIHLNASEHKHELEQKTLEMKILKERHEAMKRKLLKLHNANQSINVAADLIPAMPASISLGDNIDPNASEYEHQLELKSINHHASSTYQNLKNRMTRWIWSKVSPAYSEINAACHV